MLKKITLLLVTFFFWSCGYEPLYLKKNRFKTANKYHHS